MTEQQADALIALQTKLLAVNRRMSNNLIWFFWLSILALFGWMFALVFAGVFAAAFAG